MRSAAVFREPGGNGGRYWDYPNADYALCAWGPGGHGITADPYYRWPDPSVTAAQVARPTETIALIDGWTAPGWTIADGWRLAAAIPGHVLRHGRGVNASFVDGHARWLPAEEMWRVTTDERGFSWLHYAAIDYR